MNMTQNWTIQIAECKVTNNELSQIEAVKTVSWKTSKCALNLDRGKAQCSTIHKMWLLMHCYKSIICNTACSQLFDLIDFEWFCMGQSQMFGKVILSNELFRWFPLRLFWNGLFKNTTTILYCNIYNNSLKN